MENERHIAILGGSFDPPTIAHIQIACEVYNSIEGVHEVWMVPCGDNREDKKNRTPAAHRSAMLKGLLGDIVFEDFPIKICDFEVEKGYTPTYQLLTALKEENPSFKFSFCIGTDLVNSVFYWKNAEKLLNEVQFIVLRRPNYSYDEIESALKEPIVVESNYDGSSTRIRKRIEKVLKEKKDKCVEKDILFGLIGQTSKSVINYIYTHGLYSIKPCKGQADI